MANRVYTPESQYGLPLGVVPEAELAASSVTLAPGGLIVLYTDGITEASDADHREFGLSGLMAEMEAHGPVGPEAVREAALSALDEHRGAVELADDTTLVVLRALAVEQGSACDG